MIDPELSYFGGFLIDLAIYTQPSSPTEEEDYYTQALKQDSSPVKVHCPDCQQTFDYPVSKEKIHACLAGIETKIITTCRFCKKPLIGRLVHTGTERFSA